MTLELTDWFIWNNSNTQDVATMANPDLAKLSFGDEYEGYFTYSTDAGPITNQTEIRFNPGMFVTDGFDDISNLGGEERYYLKKVGLTNTFTDFEWGVTGSNNAYTTTRNFRYQVRRRTATSFQIKVTFFMLSDTRTYLGAAGITGGQFSRLTSDRFSQNPTLYTNTSSSVYTVNQTLDNYTLGMYVGLVIDVQGVAPVTMTATGGAATPTSPFELIIPVGIGNFVTDGWDNPCGGTGPTDVSLTLYEDGDGSNPRFFNGVLDPTLTTATKLVFTSSTTYPVDLDGEIFAFEISADDCDLSVLYGTLEDDEARVRTWDYLNIDGLFANDGIHNDRVFQLTRGGADVNTINVNIPTTLNFNFTYTGTDVNRCSLWIIPTSMGNSSTENWFDSLERTPIQFTAVDSINNTGGNNWEITKVIDPIALNLQLNTTFHFLFVLYDDVDNYYASYSHTDVPVSNIQEVPDDGTFCGEELGITGSLTTYKDEFTTDYLQVSPLQRVKANTNYNKASYNECTDFNRIQSITATLELLNGTVLKTANITVNGGVATSTNPTIFIRDLPLVLEIDWVFRIEDIYTNQEIRVQWVVNTLTEPTEIIFYQQFRVDDYQQNLPAVEQILTNTVFRDLGGFILEPDTGRNCSGEDIIVETIRDESRGQANYEQTAVWLDDDRRVEEEDGAPQRIENVPQLFTTFQSNVEEDFLTNLPNNEVSHQITSSVNSGDVGIVAYPPPFTDNVARVMIHNTLPNGRSVSFRVGHTMLNGPKVLSVLTGVSTSADYMFRIGDTNADLSDGNAAAWSSFTSITFAQLTNSSATVGQYIRVEYSGTPTRTDIPSYLDYFTDSPITALSSISVGSLASRETAAGDIMLFTGTDTSLLGITTTSANRFTGKRTIAELVASSDLTDYVAFPPVGTAPFQPPNSTTGNHLYLDKTSINGLDTVDISLEVLVNNLTLSSITSPLQNRFYPVTGNGLNVPALQGDDINDLLFVPNGANGSNKLYPEYMGLGEERSYTVLGRQFGLGIYTSPTGSFIRYLGNSNFILLQFTGGTLRYRFATSIPFGTQAVSYVTYTITRTALTGTAAQCYDVKLYVNGKEVPIISETGSISNNTPSVGMVQVQRYNLGLLNSTTDGRANFFQTTLNYLSVHNRILTFKEIRELHLGKPPLTFAPLYHYDFTSVTPGTGTKFISNTGSGTIDDCRLENHTNTLTTLFP